MLLRSNRCSSGAAEDETSAQIVLVQEHHAVLKDVDWLREELYARGWQAALTPAICTEKGGTSAGSAILFRDSVDVRYGFPSELDIPQCGGRVATAIWRTPGGFVINLLCTQVLV